MRGFGLGKSWRTGGVSNTQYNGSGTFTVPFGKQFTQVSGAGTPGPAASFTPAAPTSYYAGAPSSYYAGSPGVYSPASYYAGTPSQYVQYNYNDVTAYYFDGVSYYVYASGQAEGSCPAPAYFYNGPGAYTQWTCQPRISFAYFPGAPASYFAGGYTPSIPSSYYAGAPAVYYAGAPAVYYAGATGPTNVVLGVTFPGGPSGSPGSYVNPTTIDTEYIYTYPNSYNIPNLSGGYVIISVN